MEKSAEESREILGHKNIKQFLGKSIKNGKLSHAYLFIGPKGIGKREMAIKFLNSIICSSSTEEGEIFPCRVCPACLKFNSANFLDLHYVDRSEDGSSISIEKIRSLIHDLNLKPLHSDYKFALINADYLTIEASNSFLKTLEEPSHKTIIILLSTNTANLPETIVSRCQVIRFNRVRAEEIFNHLIDKKIEKKLAKELSFLSEGKPGKVSNFISNTENYSNYKHEVEDCLSLLKLSLLQRLNAISDILPTNIPLTEARDRLTYTMTIFLNIFRDSLLLKLGAETNMTHLFLKAKINNFSKDISRNYLEKLIRVTIESQRLIKNNVNPKLVFENYVLNF